MVVLVVGLKQTSLPEFLSRYIKLFESEARAQAKLIERTNLIRHTARWSAAHKDEKHQVSRVRSATDAGALHTSAPNPKTLHVLYAVNAVHPPAPRDAFTHSPRGYVRPQRRTNLFQPEANVGRTSYTGSPRLNTSPTVGIEAGLRMSCFGRGSRFGHMPDQPAPRCCSMSCIMSLRRRARLCSVSKSCTYSYRCEPVQVVLLLAEQSAHFFFGYHGDEELRAKEMCFVAVGALCRDAAVWCRSTKNADCKRPSRPLLLRTEFRTRVEVRAYERSGRRGGEF
ncbi:hypothetical protein HDV57DRAFT_331178 [Trichoderma longibrachiatum]|uniref:Uncharacterized protein n=1 Tax=Trichoderma longibrachiatum ATCC 18648 TaxID=983965 RepID=A0A2T4BVJ6_TRILO|nr:hypothetical protein M440DRAFT_128843 [Trichoderma longibrachiatum ATCC 18648]